MIYAIKGFGCVHMTYTNWAGVLIIVFYSLPEGVDAHIGSIFLFKTELIIWCTQETFSFAKYQEFHNLWHKCSNGYGSIIVLFGYVASIGLYNRVSVVSNIPLGIYQWFIIERHNIDNNTVSLSDAWIKCSAWIWSAPADFPIFSCFRTFSMSPGEIFCDIVKMILSTCGQWMNPECRYF